MEEYKPTGFALDIFKKRYSLHENETFADACDRVALHAAAAEQNGNVIRYRTEFSELLRANMFMPGGRIWYGSGRPKGQLLNCFVAPTVDSREGWGKAFYDETVICGTGGGLGMNCTPIRPRGSKIGGQKGTSTGAVSLMECIDAIGERLKAGGGRRTALMLALSLTHGDIVEFLDKKLDLKQLNNANVSVIFDEDPEAFFEKVKSDDDVELKFGGKVVGKAKAKDLWHKIVKNALSGGEPGVLNGYLANKMSNIWYHEPLICTNPCGEIWLAAYDCCCLGALVLPRFVRSEADNGTHTSYKGESRINWDMLKKAIATSVRFLDNVLTVNNYPLPEIKETCHEIRRIGLGIMGLHDMLLMLGLKYSSPAGLEMVDKIMGFIKNRAYEASVDLAEEKGPFPAFDSEKYLKGGFAKTLKPTLRKQIQEHGIRNCAILTIAPTGTTSLVCDVTSGIEPMFAAAHIRKYRDGDVLKQEVVIHPLFKKYVDAGLNVKHFQGALDIKMRDHFEMQRTCQRHLDNACSKTINLVHGTSEKELSDMYMEFLPELKGVTVYPDGSREDQPLTPISLDEAIAAVKGKADKILMSYTKDACKDGMCDV